MAFPFGKTIVKDTERGDLAKSGHIILNIIWFPIGLFIAVSHLLLAIPLFIGIITIPLAIVCVRVAKFAFFPFWIRVITQEEALARRTAEILYQKQGATNNTPSATSSPPSESNSKQDETQNIPNSRLEEKHWDTEPIATQNFKEGIGMMRDEIRKLYTTFRSFQRSHISDELFYKWSSLALLVFLVGIWVFSYFYEPEYFVGKNVKVDSIAKTAKMIDWDKPVSGKVIFKKDGDLLLSYAIAKDGYIDTTFENYLNGKPKSETKKTHDWNKDTKSEYMKEWFQNWQIKYHFRYDKDEEWLENGVKIFEKSKDIDGWFEIVKRWNNIGVLITEVKTTFGLKEDKKNEYSKEWNENGILIRHKSFGREEEWYDAGTKSVEKTTDASTGIETVKRWNQDEKLVEESQSKGGISLWNTILTYGTWGVLNTKTITSFTGSTLEREALKKTINEIFYPSGIIQSRKTLEGNNSILSETYYENGDIEKQEDLKNGSGTIFYPGNRIKEYTDSGTGASSDGLAYIKVGYFQNGSKSYDYRSQVGKMYDENGSIVEECKITKNKQSEVPNCIGNRNSNLCYGTKTITYDSYDCFDSSWVFLYEAHSGVGWKKLKTIAEIRELSAKNAAKK